MRWERDALLMLDQRLLPTQERWLRLARPEDVARAIADMAVRGAPAIGVAAAYGMALAAGQGEDRALADALLRASRPTAVNLFWALDRMALVEPWTFEKALREAQAIEREDREMNLAIGKNGAPLVRPLTADREVAQVLTICNTGALATAGFGTALGIIRAAHRVGASLHVWACETRPRMQGLRLTAWELLHEGIPFHAIADLAAASLMRKEQVDLVIVGADRIAANGDFANKIGTYALAVLARHHQIPFYVAAPSSTFDMALTSGGLIPIEERSGEELTTVGAEQCAPQGCPVFNPAFDVTPGSLVTAFVTERGVFRAADLMGAMSTEAGARS